jgi:hypothetical protein
MDVTISILHPSSYLQWRVYTVGRGKTKRNREQLKASLEVRWWIVLLNIDAQQADYLDKPNCIQQRKSLRNLL